MSEEYREEVAAEMAALSVVKSEELVALTNDATALSRLQDDLNESKDRVQTVKEILVTTPDHELTTALATTLDRQLERSVVEIPPTNDLGEVEGVESLGVTLMPSRYRSSRISGCENFLSDFFKASREVTTRIGSNFKDSYILFTESQDSLEKALNALEAKIDAAPNYDENLDRILLGSRLFNLFKINGQVDENWVANISKLTRTISGLTNNYYLNNKNTLNTALSYFGGFQNISENGDSVAMERLSMLPTSIPSERFKECTYPNKTVVINNGNAKQSVELMGGAYFVDVRNSKPKHKLEDVSEVESYLSQYTDVDGTYFEKSAENIFPKFGNEIKSFSKPQTKLIIKHLRELLKEWRKIFDNSERYKLVESDYVEISKGIYESDLSDKMKETVHHAFATVVRKNQMELLQIRSSVNAYLVLLVKGLIELSETSLKANMAI